MKKRKGRQALVEEELEIDTYESWKRRDERRES